MTTYKWMNAEHSLIGSDDGRFFPPADGNIDYVAVMAWVAAGGRIAEYVAPPAEPRLVRKSLIVSRLNDVGKLAAASQALNSDLYSRERWYAPDQPAVHADNPEVVALLKAIGADLATILAPE